MHNFKKDTVCEYANIHQIKSWIEDSNKNYYINGEARNFIYWPYLVLDDRK